jgi:hypothetical protein
MPFLASLCVVLLLAVPAAASFSKVTYYLDGARIESEAAALNGQIEILLPRGAAVESLRLKPIRDATIIRVEFADVAPDRSMKKEITRLGARRDLLSDRLKALDVKEDIYRAAAKSQSGKAPRSTKTNREPLENIRKGTDFALSQLEEIYRARRKADSELKGIDARLSGLNEAGTVGGRVARVWLAEKNGRVAVSYLNSGMKWTPVYDFRLNGKGDVEIIMNALLPASGKGAEVGVVPSILSESSPEPPIAIVHGGPAKGAVFRFPLERESYSVSPQSALSFLFTNRSVKSMPPGEATCYRQGEYIGKASFKGCRPGESISLDFGNAHVSAQ